VEVGVRAVREGVLAQRAKAALRQWTGLAWATGVTCHVEEDPLDDVAPADEGLVDGSRQLGTEAVLLDAGGDEGKEAGHLRFATLDR
jgi:hypothetical protein